jgi:hypothetical protein
VYLIIAASINGPEDIFEFEESIYIGLYVELMVLDKDTVRCYDCKRQEDRNQK